MNPTGPEPHDAGPDAVPAGPNPAGPTPAGPNPAGPTPAGPVPVTPTGSPVHDHPNLHSALSGVFGPDSRLPIDPDLSPDDSSEPSAHRPRPSQPVHRAHPKILIAIACGGAIGTLGRYELTMAWPIADGHFPMAVFVINTSGAFLLGLLLTLVLERLAPTRYLRPFAGVGVLGGWTTMSTLAAGADTLIWKGHALLALVYLAATLVAGVAAVATGTAIGRLGAPSQDSAPDEPMANAQ